MSINSHVMVLIVMQISRKFNMKLMMLSAGSIVIALESTHAAYIISATQEPDASYSSNDFNLQFSQLQLKT